MNQALRDGRAGGDCWHVRSDGSRFWGLGLTVPREVPGAGVVRTVRDRTGERVAGEQLRESEARFQALAASVPQLVFRARRTGHRTWSSPQWEACAGLGDADSRGLGWLQAIHPDDVDLIMRGWDAASSGGEYRVEHRIRHAAQGLYRRTSSWRCRSATPPMPRSSGSAPAPTWRICAACAPVTRSSSSNCAPSWKACRS